jgi:DNA repair exonuclease SbcCD ATPase subunit
VAKFVLQDGTEVEAFTADELQAKIAEEVSGLKAKRDELLGLHTKDKERLAELEKAQREAEEARQREKGEFKQLYEKTQAELESERDQARKFRQQVQEKEIESATLSLIGDLTRDTARATLLKKEAMQFAKYTDEGVQFEIGGVAVDAAKLKEKLASDYPFLIDGSGASGGGAQGGSRNGKAGKKFNEYSGDELSAIRRESPQEYDRLKREFYSTT